MVLTEWESLSHMLALFAGTALVDGAQPQSLLLVGPPGQGKSTIVKRFKHWPYAHGASAISVDGLRDLLSQDAAMRLLVLDEFQRLFSMTRDAVQNVCGLLLSLLSGDATNELVGPKGKGHRMNLNNRQLACMSSIPADVLITRLQDIQGTGLLSRFCLQSVIRSEQEAARVRKNILWAKVKNVDPFVLADLRPYPFPAQSFKTQQKVTLTKEAARELEAWAPDTFPKADDRKIVMCVTLAQSVAVLNGRTIVGRKDITELRTFTPYLTSLTYEGTVAPRQVPPLKRHPSWHQQ